MLSLAPSITTMRSRSASCKVFVDGKLMRPARVDATHVAVIAGMDRVEKMARAGEMPSEEEA